jgi:hypothetical protein
MKPDPMVNLLHGWSQNLTREQAVVLTEYLSDIPTDVLAEVVHQALATQEFRPSIAWVRARAATITLGLPSDEETLRQRAELDHWERFRHVAQGAGERHVVPEVHPVVWAAWESAGADCPDGVFSARWKACRDQAIAHVVQGNMGQLSLVVGS